MDRVRKAVIPAAGIGKRFYPLTRAQPKEMLPILDKPVIHYIVQEAVNSGLDDMTNLESSMESLTESLTSVVALKPFSISNLLTTT